MASILDKSTKDESKKALNDCLICLEPCDNSDATNPIQCTPCFHLFHRSCIFRWINEQYQKHQRLMFFAPPAIKIECPNCKFDISKLLQIVPLAILNKSSSPDDNDYNDSDDDVPDLIDENEDIMSRIEYENVMPLSSMRITRRPTSVFNPNRMNFRYRPPVRETPQTSSSSGSSSSSSSSQPNTRIVNSDNVLTTSTLPSSYELTFVNDNINLFTDINSYGNTTTIRDGALPYLRLLGNRHRLHHNQPQRNVSSVVNLTPRQLSHASHIMRQIYEKSKSQTN
jgi:hypothetical protein